MHTGIHDVAPDAAGPGHAEAAEPAEPDVGVGTPTWWRSDEATLRAADAFAAARTPLRASHPGSTLPALGELWFYGEGTGCP